MHAVSALTQLSQQFVSSHMPICPPRTLYQQYLLSHIPIRNIRTLNRSFLSFHALTARLLPTLVLPSQAPISSSASSYSLIMGLSISQFIDLYWTAPFCVFIEQIQIGGSALSACRSSPSIIPIRPNLDQSRGSNPTGACLREGGNVIGWCWDCEHQNFTCQRVLNSEMFYYNEITL